MLGWFTDPTDTNGGPYASGGNPNDLHCNPVQTFPQLPPAGGLLQGFGTTYQAQTTNNNVTIRLALYSVSTAGVYTLVAGTAPGSDMVAPYSAAVAGVQQTISTSGPLSYPSASTTSVQILPSLSYSLCFSSSALNQSVTSFLQYYWQNQAGSLLLQPYYLSSPLPSPLTSGTGVITTSSNSWQIWMNVLAPGAYSSSSSAPSALSTSSTPTSASAPTATQMQSQSSL